MRSAVFSSDRSQVVTASADWTAKLWSTDSGLRERNFEGHTNWVNTAVLSPDSQQLVTSSRDGTAWLWCPATGICIRVFTGHSNLVLSAAFAPLQSRLVMEANADELKRPSQIRIEGKETQAISNLKAQSLSLEKTESRNVPETEISPMDAPAKTDICFVCNTFLVEPTVKLVCGHVYHKDCIEIYAKATGASTIDNACRRKCYESDIGTGACGDTT